MARVEGKWTVIGSVAGVAAALIALVALVVQVDTGQTSSGRSQTQSTGAGAAATTATAPTASTRPPSPTPSSASAMTDSDKEFAAAKTGACFDAVYDLLDGNTASDGSDGGPQVVLCTSGQAYYKVTKAYRPESEGSCAQDRHTRLTIIRQLISARWRPRSS